jgi:hypothetical protein
MSENSCCSFCEQLPTVNRPSRGAAGKCPLCKQDLWTSPDGVTYRLVADGEGAARRTVPRFLLAGLGAGLLALTIAGVAITRLAWRTPERVSVGQPAPVVAPRESLIAAGRVKSVGLPPAQVKRAIPDNAARVKPAKSMEPLAKSAVKSIPHTFADEGPTAKGVQQPIPAEWTHRHMSEETLKFLLCNTPQLDLDPNYAKKSAKDLAALAKELAKQNADAKDGFIMQLKKDRADLAGLPFLMGKDCTLEKGDAKALAEASVSVRFALDGRRSAARANKRPSSSTPEDFGMAYEFAGAFTVPTEYVPAAHQILSASPKDFRFVLAVRLKEVKGPKATSSLVKLALFDLDAKVRREATKALEDRPKAEYLDEVAKAFRYPWAPIARHASEAAASLKLKELIPDLVATFNEPDPTEPFMVKSDDGKQKKMIRELVRINHHRNCMLCHAPLGDAKVTRDIPLGPAVSMQNELPPISSAVYYSERGGAILVRADITYLRQDFSVVQEVNNPGKWPVMQRFDYFLRTREFGENETFEALPEVTPHRQAVLEALEGLTGRSGPPRADAWQEEVRAAPARKTAPKAKSPR